jgi:hypothetical protein
MTKNSPIDMPVLTIPPGKLTFEEFLQKYPPDPEDLEVAADQEGCLILHREHDVDFHEQLINHQHREYHAYLNGDPFYNQENTLTGE